MTCFAQGYQVIIDGSAPISPGPNMMHVQLDVDIVRWSSPADHAFPIVSFEDPYSGLLCWCSIASLLWQVSCGNKANLSVMSA